MKTGLLASAVGFFFTLSSLTAQITLNSAGSYWGPGNTFYGSGSMDAGDPYRTIETPWFSPALLASTAFAVNNMNGSRYEFVFANYLSKDYPENISSYDLSGTALTASTPLVLQFTNLGAVPKYIAYTGGDLFSLSYSSENNGTLTLRTSVINPVASFSDPTGSLLQAGFGLMIETGGDLDFGGAVFQTDMYLFDISPLDTGYAGQDLLAGVNANGQNGSLVTFTGYFPTDFMAAEFGITSVADVEAAVQKASTSFSLDVTRTYFAADGIDPAGEGYTFGGSSTFDFDGGGTVDNTLVVTYSNNSWSSGNIGIVPEPSTSLLLLLSGAAFAPRRMRRRRQ